MEDTKISREGDRQRHREGGDIHRDIEVGEIDRDTYTQRGEIDTDRQTHTHTRSRTATVIPIMLPRKHFGIKINVINVILGAGS